MSFFKALLTRFNEDDSFFSFIWIGLHALTILAMFLALLLSLCSFGCGTGFNPPVDYHIPISEEIAELAEEEYGSLTPDKIEVIIKDPQGELTKVVVI